MFAKWTSVFFDNIYSLFSLPQLLVCNALWDGEVELALEMLVCPKTGDGTICCYSQSKYYRINVNHKNHYIMDFDEVSAPKKLSLTFE